jgi:diadenosine tetraphosphate (Ap4A) HIT family hydrolase
METNCYYCAKDDRLEKLMIEICPLNFSTLYLFKEQTHKGRCIVAYHKHEKELFHLKQSELTNFMTDVSLAAEAIFKSVNPQKLNYGAYGDKMPHLHMHIVPKYENGTNWGSTFEMNPGKTYLEESEYLELIKVIKSNILESTKIK